MLCGSKFARRDAPGYYQSLQDDHVDEETTFTRQIDTDLHRTCPEQIQYASEYYTDDSPSPALAKLRRVLVAYGFHNPVVGYCQVTFSFICCFVTRADTLKPQGMNFLAAFLLSVLAEEDAFWTLVTVIDRLLPANYYDSNLTGIKAEADIFELIVARELPELNAHLKHHNIDMAMFTLDWFVSLFTVNFRARVSKFCCWYCLALRLTSPKNNNEKKTTQRVWDLFLYEGRVSLFCVALSIVRQNATRLMEFKSMDKLFEAVRGLAERDYNVDALIKTVNVPAMSTTVKRLAFSIVQTPMFSETISNSRSAHVRICFFLLFSFPFSPGAGHSPPRFAR